MLTPEELIEMMENVGYASAYLPERCLHAFDPTEDALPVLAPVTVNWPDEETGFRFECRIWFDFDDCEASPEVISDFAARFNWIHAPWKLLFNPDEFDFCIQMIWPGGEETVQPEEFFAELLSGCCLVHCLFAAIASVEEGTSAEEALLKLENEYVTLSDMVDQQADELFTEDLYDPEAGEELPKKVKKTAKKKTVLKPKAEKVKKSKTEAVKKKVEKPAPKTVKMAKTPKKVEIKKEEKTVKAKKPAVKAKPKAPKTK